LDLPGWPSWRIVADRPKPHTQRDLSTPYASGQLVLGRRPGADGRRGAIVAQALLAGGRLAVRDRRRRPARTRVEGAVSAAPARVRQFLRHLELSQRPRDGIGFGLRHGSVLARCAVAPALARLVRR